MRYWYSFCFEKKKNNTIAAQAAPAADLRALFDATKTEVEELKRRALEVERKSSDKRTKWEWPDPRIWSPTYSVVKKKLGRSLRRTSWIMRMRSTPA